MPVVGGFTPADQIIAFNGFAWASVMHRFLLNAHAYEVMVLVGMLAVVLKGLGTRDFSGVWIYLVVATATFVLFGASLQPIAQVSVPAAVAGGATTTGAVDGTNMTQVPSTLSEVGLPMGFFIVTNAMDSFTRSMLNRTAGDFVKNPFVLHAALNRLAAEHFQNDPALQQQLSQFTDDCYSHALLAWSRDHPTPTNDEKLSVDTPGGPGIVPYYAKVDLTTTNGATCDAAWSGGAGAAGGGLRAALLTYVKQQVAPAANIVQQAMSTIGFPRSDDAWLQSTLRSWREVNTNPIPENTASSAGKLNPIGLVSSVANFGLTGISKITNRFMIAQMSEFIRISAYPVYGFTLMALYGLYPIVLALALLPGQGMRLLQYFLVVFSVKLWPLIWAMIAYAHTAALPYFTGGPGMLSASQDLIVTDPGSWSYPGLIQMIAAMMYLTAPTITSLILGVAGVRHLGGAMGQWQTTSPMSLLGLARLGKGR